MKYQKINADRKSIFEAQKFSQKLFLIENNSVMSQALKNFYDISFCTKYFAVIRAKVIPIYDGIEKWAKYKSKFIMEVWGMNEFWWKSDWRSSPPKQHHSI